MPPPPRKKEASCSREKNHKHGYWRFSLYYGEKHKINAIKIENVRKKCVKILESNVINESDAVRLSVQVRELCEWKDK